MAPRVPPRLLSKVLSRVLSKVLSKVLSRVPPKVLSKVLRPYLQPRNPSDRAVDGAGYCLRFFRLVRDVDRSFQAKAGPFRIP